MTTVSTNLPRGVDLRALVNAIAPKRFMRDPFGLFSGYRAYLVHTDLSAKSDDELQALGLARKDVPRVAMEAVFEERDR